MRSRTAFLFACFLLSFNIGNGQDLILKLNDGSEIEYALNTIQNMSYEDGSLNVKLTSENVESYELATIWKILFSVSESSGSDSPERANIEVFPNPTSDFVKVRILDSKKSELKIELINSSAQLIISKQFDTRYSNEITLDISSQPSGLYYLRITEEKNQIITKIIKP